MMTIAIALYLIGVIGVACICMFLIMLGNGCDADESVKMFFICVGWPVFVSYLVFKFIRIIFFR